MLDARTAVSIARLPNVDLRFFLRPPYSHIKHKLHVCYMFCNTIMFTRQHLKSTFLSGCNRKDTSITT